MKKRGMRLIAVILVMAFAMTTVFYFTGRDVKAERDFSIEKISKGINDLGNTVEANGPSERPVISDDGRFIVYHSKASNLFQGYGGPHEFNNQIFLFDRTTSMTECITYPSATLMERENKKPAISENGRYIAFESHLKEANNLTAIDIYLYDMEMKIFKNITSGGFNTFPKVSSDGRYVVFESRSSYSDVNKDIYLYNIQTENRSCISNGKYDGDCKMPDISGDGKYVTFSTMTFFENNIDGITSQAALSCYQIVVYDTTAATNPYKYVSVTSSKEFGSQFSVGPAVSYNGRYISFRTMAKNLKGDSPEPYVFLYDRDNSTEPLKKLLQGAHGDEDYTTEMSKNGKYLGFVMNNAALPSLTPVPGVPTPSPLPNKSEQMVMYDIEKGKSYKSESEILTNAITFISCTASGEYANGQSLNVSLSADGGLAVFQSAATNLTSSESGASNVSDIYLCNLFEAGISENRLPVLLNTMPPERVRADMQGVEAGGKIYIVGGHNYAADQERSSYVDVFDPNANNGKGSITPASNLQTGRWDLAVAKFTSPTSGHYIYALGGVTNDSAFSKKVERLDVRNGTWTYKPDMATARVNFGAVEVNGEIYVMGGLTESGFTGSMEVFNHNSGTWSTASYAPMPTPCAGFGIVTDGSKIYVVGGRTGENSYLGGIQIYDIASNQWSVAPGTMAIPRADMAVGLKNGKIYIAGGWNGIALNEVEKFDIASGIWSMAGYELVRRHSAAYGYVGNDFYIIGGESDGCTGVVEKYKDLN
ncbi:MAG: hypothetical protein N2645_13110 [Clostridia bacterium]|nr:hypothetical protein [Clostridia bacterium]